MIRRTLVVALVLVGMFGLGTGRAGAAVLGYYRFPTIHGDSVVFNCEGDLWKVSASGGVAMRLTSHPANESSPFFSPDGRMIAFSADYQGNGDIYVMPADGGEPKRLTYHPSREQCAGWTPDGKFVLFTARRSGLDSESTLYKVPVEGGEPEQVPVGVAGSASFSGDGRMIAFNPFTWGGTWKRYRGGTAPEIWVGDLGASKFWKLTNNDAVDQNPMWVGDRIYFLSERSFPVNIWSSKPDGTDARQLTHHNDYDVRSADSDGRQIVYSMAGDLYVVSLTATGSTSAQPRKIDVTIPTDRIRERPRVEDASKTIEGFDLSSDGKRLLVSSRGEVWNAPAKPGGRIISVTNNSSGTRERVAVFSPDNKKIALVSDETGEQEVAIYDAAGKDGHKILTKAGKGWLFAPAWSNDSKWIMYADMTGTLYLVDAESGESKVVDQDKNWELTEYTFSPDSKWIAYTKLDDNKVQSIYLYQIDGGAITKVSSGFTADYSPAWDSKGRYLYFLSDRTFHPILDTLDREFIEVNTTKPCCLILSKDGKSPFLADEVLGEDEDEAKDKADKAEKKDASPASSQASAASAPTTQGDDKKPKWAAVKIDLDGIQQRVVEFPVKAANMYALGASDSKVFWVTRPLQGMGEDPHEDDFGPGQPRGSVHAFDLKKKKDETYFSKVNIYTLSRDGKKIAWRQDKEIRIADSGSKPGDEIETKVSLGALPLEVNPADEWKQIFAEAWRLQRDFYWAENMVGVDWPAMRARYEPLLARVGSRGEMNDVIGQLIGELGTSHTYVFGGDSAFNPPNPVPTGVLGADIELDKASGLHKFVKVLRPEPFETDIDAPLTLSHANIHDGDFLLAVNGHELKPTDNADAQFINLAEVEVLLTVASKPDKSDARDVQVKTLRDDTELRYADWCRRNREYVDRVTGGRVGYFHLPDMGGAGLIKFVKGFYPQLTKDALIIDDRDNHGGFVSQMMIEKLNRKVWAYDRPRRGLGGTYPDRAHVGYKCVLIDEHSGSDGDIFPDSFRTLGIGPLIGKRTWGGVVGIRGDKSFVDAGMTTQPEFAWWDAKRGWSIENHGVDPDIEVEWTPEDRLAGKDPQLDRAIAEMMRSMKEKPIDKPKAPPLPIRAPQPTAASAK